MAEKPFKYVETLNTVHIPMDPKWIDDHYGHYIRPNIPTMDKKVNLKHNHFYLTISRVKINLLNSFPIY